MTEMIERVAKRIAFLRMCEHQGNHVPCASCLNMRGYNDDVGCITLARAAIEALLKPTPEMLAAMEPWTRVSGHQDSIWKVGIETALGKSPLRPAGTADEHGVPRAEE